MRAGSIIVVVLSRVILALMPFALAGFIGHASAAEPKPGVPPVAAPPESFFEKFRQRDREAARKFYKKHLDVKGLSVAAAAEVADEALQRTHSIVTHMLAGRTFWKRWSRTARA